MPRHSDGSGGGNTSGRHRRHGIRGPAQTIPRLTVSNRLRRVRMVQPRVAKFGLFALVVLCIGVLIGRFLI